MREGWFRVTTVIRSSREGERGDTERCFACGPSGKSVFK